MSNKPKKNKAPAYLPQGYKNSTRVRQLDGDTSQAVAKEKDYWDGRKDAKVYPKPVRSSSKQIAEQTGTSLSKLQKEQTERRMDTMSQRAREAKEYLRNRER